MSPWRRGPVATERSERDGVDRHRFEPDGVAPGAEVVVHVERTADPAVLRWITHDLTAAIGNPAEGDALAELLRIGAIESAAIDGDGIAVRGPTRWPPRLADQVHHAIVDDLTELTTATPTVSTLQRVIDATVGGTASDHGGEVKVVDVDGPAGEVFVSMHGACRGCPAAAATLTLGVERAIRQCFPTITTVTEVAAPTPGDYRGATSPRALRTRAALR